MAAKPSRTLEPWVRALYARVGSSTASRIRELEAELDALRTGAAGPTPTDYTIMTLDTQGNVTSWNAAARRLMHRTGPDLLTGARVEPAPAGLVIEPDWVFEGARVEEAWYSRGDGTRFLAHEISVPLLDADRQAQGSLRILWEASGPNVNTAPAPRRSLRRLAKTPVRGIVLAAVLSAPIYVGLGMIVRWLLS